MYRSPVIFRWINDNRAWQPYGLGPGSSGALDDFNEANMKIAISAISI
jgi:hypothetical protein